MNPIRVVFIAGFALATAASANAGSTASNGGAGVRAGYITSTGETVPNPGASQSAGPTPLDHGIQRRDDEIDTSICKGC